MARRKNWSAEQIVASLRQIEVQMAQGKSLALACKEAEISEQSYYRWRNEYGGLNFSGGLLIAEICIAIDMWNRRRRRLADEAWERRTQETDI